MRRKDERECIMPVPANAPPPRAAKGGWTRVIAAALVDRARNARIEDELFRRGIKLRGRNGALDGPCPVCGGDDRFAVSIKKQVFNCGGCGARGGGAIALVRFLDGLSFGEAVRLLTGAAPQKPASGALHDPPGHRDSGEPAKAATQPPDNARKAAWLWGAREPITEGCPAGLYLRRGRRFDGPIPPTLGYLPPNGKYPPAMIAAFGFCEESEPGRSIRPPLSPACTSRG
jgi:CHC2 zinc finger